MVMEVDSKILHGTSYEMASCMGMPHLGARYLGDSVRKTKLLFNAKCAFCGGTVGSIHHEPPVGPGGAMRGWTLRTERGIFVLKPALIALCGSGTTGCHGRRHAGELRFEWRWLNDDAESRWWDGWWLSHGVAPHDERLYQLGGWWVVTEDGERLLKGAE